METKKSVFEVLNAIDCNEHVEKKNGLSYLSWAWAWSIAKKNFPDANYTIYENADGWNYFTDGRTCWVKTGVTIDGITHVENLPVMDFKNTSIPLERVTSFDVNKAIQRSLTKALARHGLGLYIYAGEDLPEEALGNPFEDAPKAAPVAKKLKKRTSTLPPEPVAPVPPAPSPAYQPMEIGRYYDCISAEAKGMRSKTGRSIKESWISITHAGPAEIAEFEEAVRQYKMVNGL